MIQHNSFDDLDDTDAVHGFGGGVIRANHMDHALPHGGGNHNDFIQIGAGGPWTIDGNWFGVRTGGAASIWLDPINGGLIHDAVIENNVVTGHYGGQYVGIFVGGDGTLGGAAAAEHDRRQQHRHLGTLELPALRARICDAAASSNGRWSSTTRASG